MERDIMGGGDKISWALMSIAHMVNSHKYFINIPDFTFVHQASNCRAQCVQKENYTCTITSL